MKKRVKAVFFSLMLLIAVLSSALTVSAENPLIYVSGNPDNYPIEYFDSESKTFAGYIPELLSQFGENYGYRIEYLNIGVSDNRQGDYKNAQAEIISSATKEEFSAEQLSGAISVFSADEEYYILFTETANEKLKNELTEFFSKITSKKSNEVLLSVTGEKPADLPIAVIVIAAALFLITIFVIILLAVRLKKYRKLTDNKDTDIITGVGNYLYLERYFKQFITDKNRSLYSAVYFGAYLKDGREDQNEFLKTIAVLLNAELGDTDILSRIDDGFFILKNLSEAEGIENWTEAVLNKLITETNDRKEFNSANITAGIYNLGTYDRDLDRMISNSAYCCRYARKNNKSYSVYSRAIEKAEKEEDKLREDIKSAFINDEFTAYLQFFVNAQSKQILGAEALSRWNHPTLGVLSPAKYIEILESEHLIGELDFTIMRKACEILEEVCSKTNKAFFVAFNFSRNTLISPDFVKRVENIIADFNFPKECLLLEVTEYTQISESQILFDNIKKIKKLGIRVVIDDFGSGFTDLVDIGKGDFDGVKLDKSLIDGEHTKADDIILKSLVDLMHNLNMTVIAEGIETEEQAIRLMRAGCSVIQGFYYYLPMPKLEALRVFLK